MKTLSFLFVLFILSACNRDIDLQLLAGSWKPRDEITKTGLNSYSTITFLNNDSITAKTFSYGRLTSEISGKYKVDTQSNMLHTAYGDTISYDLEIVRLNKNELELYYLKTKQYQKYLRF